MSAKYYIYKKVDYEKVVDGLQLMKDTLDKLNLDDYGTTYLFDHTHFLLKNKYGQLIARTYGGFRPVLFKNDYIDNSVEFMSCNANYIIIDEYGVLYEYDKFLSKILEMNNNSMNSGEVNDATKDEYGFYWR